MRRPWVALALLVAVALSGCYGASGCIAEASWNEPGLFGAIQGPAQAVDGWAITYQRDDGSNVTGGLVEVRWEPRDGNGTVRSVALRPPIQPDALHIVATWYAHEAPTDLDARLEGFLSRLQVEVASDADLVREIELSGTPAGTTQYGEAQIPIRRGAVTAPGTWDPEGVRPMLSVATERTGARFGEATLDATWRNDTWSLAFDLPLQNIDLPGEERSGRLVVDALDRVEHHYHRKTAEDSAAYQADIRSAFTELGLPAPTFAGFHRDDTCRDTPA